MSEPAWMSFEEDKVSITEMIDLGCLLVAVKCRDGVDAVIDILPRKISMYDINVWLEEKAFAEAVPEIKTFVELCAEGGKWDDVVVQ
jgi:hypothetical protein